MWRQLQCSYWYIRTSFFIILRTYNTTVQHIFLSNMITWITKMTHVLEQSSTHIIENNYFIDKNDLSNNNNNNNNCFTALCPGLPGWAGTRRNITTLHPDHHPIFISFIHLPLSIASSLFKLRGWQSFRTTSFHVLFGLPVGLEPSTSHSTHFFARLSSFRDTCPYHRNLFCCSINIIISSIPSLSLGKWL